MVEEILRAEIVEVYKVIDFNYLSSQYSFNHLLHISHLSLIFSSGRPFLFFTFALLLVLTYTT